MKGHYAHKKHATHKKHKAAKHHNKVRATKHRVAHAKKRASAIAKRHG